MTPYIHPPVMGGCFLKIVYFDGKQRKTDCNFVVKFVDNTEKHNYT